MRDADSDLGQSHELIAAANLANILGEPNGTGFTALVVVDNRRGDRHWNFLAFFSLEDRLEVAHAAFAFAVGGAHGGHYPPSFIYTGIDFQDIFSQDFFVRKAEILPRTVIVEGDRPLLVDCDDNIRATLDELLKVMYG